MREESTIKNLFPATGEAVSKQEFCFVSSGSRAPCPLDKIDHMPCKAFGYTFRENVMNEDLFMLAGKVPAIPRTASF